MPANPWELRADPRPLEVAAARWDEVATMMTRRGEEIVESARRATEGWDAAAAESYDLHRRQVLDNLDRFTELAGRIASSLRAVTAVIASAQQELDRAWAPVALVPHDVVGDSQVLVFRPTEDEDRGAVARGESETDEIRRRLTSSLDEESARLRAARVELVTVRAELTTLAGGSTGGDAIPAAPEWAVESLVADPTSVPGSAQSGVTAVAGLPGAVTPPQSVSVSMPDLRSLPPSGLAPFVAAAAGGIAAGRSAGRTPGEAPGRGGMGVGAMGGRAGTASRGPAGRGRSTGSTRSTRQGDGDPVRTARGRAAPQAPSPGRTEAGTDSEREAGRDAKRAALAEKRADRAARKAEREARRSAQETSGDHRVGDAGGDRDPDAETDANDPARRR